MPSARSPVGTDIMAKRPDKTKSKGDEGPVYLEFRYCVAKCFAPACRQCGYFWGPGHERAGQHAHFGVRGLGLPS